VDEKLFNNFWKVVCDGMGSGAAIALRDYHPKLEASLQALDLTSAYWSWSSSLFQPQSHLLLCGATGLGRMKLEMKSAQTPGEPWPWSHTIDLWVLPWSEVTDITQHFIPERRGGYESRELRLSKADLCVRSGFHLDLLPAKDMDRCGGVRVLRDTVEPFTDLRVFVAAVIAAQRGRSH